MPTSPFDTPITYEALLDVLRHESPFSSRPNPLTPEMYMAPLINGRDIPKYMPIEQIYAEAKISDRKRRKAFKSALQRRKIATKIDFRVDRTTPTKPRTLYARESALQLAGRYSDKL